MKVIGIIPARLASSRFPGKPMIDIMGVPMIGHCFLRTRLSKRLSEVYVATCDKEICDYVEEIGGKAILTSDSHSRASERTAEALNIIQSNSVDEINYVMMIQGDLPLINPRLLDVIVEFISIQNRFEIVDTLSRIINSEDFLNPQNVKVVTDINDFAIYYSREPIPSNKIHKNDHPTWRQPGLITFQSKFLYEYLKLESTPLEKIESVDMNRILEHGKKIKVFKTDEQFYSVDIPSDLEVINQKLKQDEYFRKSYGKFI